MSRLTNPPTLVHFSQLKANEHQFLDHQYFYSHPNLSLRDASR